MKHSRFRKFLFLLLGASVVFAAVAWFIPYDWKPDARARFKIVASQVRRDRSNFWLTIHLKKSGDAAHDMTKPVRLITGDHRELEPADTTFSRETGPGTDEIWFKFWIEPQDFQGPLTLGMNDGFLKVRSSSGAPHIADGMMRTYTTHRW